VIAGFVQAGFKGRLVIITFQIRLDLVIPYIGIMLLVGSDIDVVEQLKICAVAVFKIKGFGFFHTIIPLI
jgi:hypothetical protein